MLKRHRAMRAVHISALLSFVVPLHSLSLASRVKASITGVHASSHVARLSSQPVLSGARVRIADLKQRLAAAGVSTAGIVEKEELVRLCAALDVSERSQSGKREEVITLDIIYNQGGAYATFDAPNGAALRLLVDTGAAVSLIATAAGTAMLRTRRYPTVSLPCPMAPPQTIFPPGVDGILGLDILRRFGALELDWEQSEMRLYARASSMAHQGNAIALPFRFKRVAAGELPFILADFGGGPSGRLDALVDTGSPVTMVTPELAANARMQGTADPNDDVISTGIDGQPTRMRAMLCERLELGDALRADSGVSHDAATVYSGNCSMMAKVGWTGTPAALLGLDVLRSGVRGGQQPFAPATVGPNKRGRLVVDFDNTRLLIVP
jgi:predicted aspartyl protease